MFGKAKQYLLRGNIHLVYGIDLGSSKTQVCIIDDDERVLSNQRVASDIHTNEFEWSL